MLGAYKQLYMRDLRAFSCIEADNATIDKMHELGFVMEISRPRNINWI
jgi:hypothetical protein